MHVTTLAMTKLIIITLMEVVNSQSTDMIAKVLAWQTPMLMVFVTNLIFALMMRKMDALAVLMKLTQTMIQMQLLTMVHVTLLFLVS